MKDVMGIINDTLVSEHLKPITQHRSISAIPMAGRYRLIDFILSSMVNSGIRNIGILTQDQYRSLMDHVKTGKEWDLGTKKEGLFILPPLASQRGSSGLGDIFYLKNHVDYLLRSRQAYVIIAGNNIVFNMDFKKAVELHKERDADITVIYSEKKKGKAGKQKRTSLLLKENDQVADMAFGTAKPISSKIALDIYILKKSVLLELIEHCAARGLSSLAVDGIIRNLNRYQVYGLEYKGYSAQIETIQDYFTANLELLQPQIWNQLFMQNGYIYTKVKDEAPVRYAKGCQVENSLVANGCIIEGTVENSLLFRGVRVHKGAVVRNSIIMQKCEIAEGALIKNAILDKEVTITEGKQLKGEESYPMVVEKRVRI